MFATHKPMAEDIFDCKILEFETLESTNLYAVENWRQQKWCEGSIVWAKQQTAGVGQSGNSWSSEVGKNLTFSIVLNPTFLSVAQQFELHKVLSVAVWQTIHELSPSLDVKIKWPNDVYIGNKKVCGILVNNLVSNNCYQLAVAGVGLNVNQTSFDKNLPNPTSLKLECQTNFELRPLLLKIAKNILSWYNYLKHNDLKTINDTYFSQMLNFGVQKKYRYQQNTIEATITGVDKFGRLQLQTTDNKQLTCDIKEIAYIF